MSLYNNLLLFLLQVSHAGSVHKMANKTGKRAVDLITINMQVSFNLQATIIINTKNLYHEKTCSMADGISIDVSLSLNCANTRNKLPDVMKICCCLLPNQMFCQKIDFTVLKPLSSKLQH